VVEREEAGLAGSSQVIIENIDSAVLRGNALGDPTVRRVPVYLPLGYESESTRRYPVVYILTGFTGRGLMLMNDTAWDENIQQRMDRLIQEGKCQPMILVMPDCFTRLGGSQYLNSTATGRYEDHVVDELVPYIDSHYRTLAAAEHRGVCGKSSGGYGSVVLAMRHPDVFSAFASHSGDMYFELCYKLDFPKYLQGVEKYGGLDAMLEDLQSMRPRGRDVIDVLNIAAMAAAYSPNPTNPRGFDLPFDEYTGELDPIVWQRWLEWDPVYMVDRYRENLRRLKLIFLDCGTRDEFSLQYGARIFMQRLRQHGIVDQVRHEEFPDGHMHIQYRYDVSLPALSEVLI
jgi:S-formylglutathione hydrolase FrmB